MRVWSYITSAHNFLFLAVQSLYWNRSHLWQERAAFMDLVSIYLSIYNWIWAISRGRHQAVTHKSRQICTDVTLCSPTLAGHLPIVTYKQMQVAFNNRLRGRQPSEHKINLWSANSSNQSLLPCRLMARSAVTLLCTVDCVMPDPAGLFASKQCCCLSNRGVLQTTSRFN